MSQIPGGRGVRYGTDSVVGYNESIDERLQRLPEIGDFVLSNFDHSTMSVSCTSDRLILYPCRIPERQLSPYEVRISIDIAVAGAVLRVAIYKFNGRTNGFAKVPLSGVIFNCNAVGESSCRVFGLVTINVGSLYYIGTCVSDAGVSFVGSMAASGLVLSPIYIEHSSATELPVFIKTSDIVGGATLGIPMVSYISKEASEVM